MTFQKNLDFIIIDDDSLNNIICGKVIKMTIPESNVKAFSDPKKGA